MKRLRLLYFSLVVVSVVFIYGVMSSTGAPASKTGAPGEGLCSDCHSGSVKTGNFISFYPDWNNTAVTSSEYVPGQDARIEITPPQGQTVGFEITAYDTNSNHVGTFYSTNADFSNSQFASGNSDYVTHSQPVSGKITVKWQAPAQGTGNVNLYAAVLFANMNGSTSGDTVYKLSLSLTEKNTTNLTSIFNNHILIYYSDNAIYATIKDLHISNVSLFSLLGEKVYSVNNPSNRLVINTSDLNKGVYIVSFTLSNGKTYSRKIAVY